MLPGLGQARVQISEQLASQITNNIYVALTTVTEDPIAAKLSSQLIEKFTASLAAEIKQKQVMTEVQTLLNDFLEEVKINYIQRLSTEDIEKILEQTRKMRTESSSSLSIPQ
jgi:membrane-associated HD superfamily phosphohydrolase